MFSKAASLRTGPVRCAWRDYRRGQSAEALVRPWLADMLGTDGFTLERDHRGRPQLRLDSRPDIDANWSHSGEALLVALGEGVAVGVDIEFLRPRPQAMALAQRFFTAAEATALLHMPPDEAEAAFVQLWCAKEAVLKAHGHGLSFGLDRLTFSAREAGWALVDCDPALGAPGDWTLQAFVPMPGYLATVAWRRFPR